MAKLQADANTVDQVHTDNQAEVEDNEQAPGELHWRAHPKHKTSERPLGLALAFVMVVQFLLVVPVLP